MNVEFFLNPGKEGIFDAHKVGYNGSK